MWLHLIGGGPGAMMQTRRHLHAAVAATGKPKALVAYVGAASNDNPAFRHMLGAAFAGSGARLEAAKLASKRASTSRAHQLLDDADLIFMSGGDVEHGMNVLRERGEDTHLRALAGAGKPFVGISAGSIMLCQSWVRFPDEDDDESAEPFTCLGIAPIIMDAHSEDDDWSELRLLLRLLAQKGEHPVGYGVPSKGCLRVEGSELTAHGDHIPRLRAHGAEPRHEEPLRAHDAKAKSAAR
jgi:peptidase E